MTTSGERTEQLDIFCHVFTSDFLSFIDVELIRLFHGALQLLVGKIYCPNPPHNFILFSIPTNLFHLHSRPTRYYHAILVQD